MLSQRHNSEPAGDPRDTYLDAARACILDVGWRRTTLTEVARRAGVSRMTIYRAWPDMPALLGDLMTREWSVLVRETGPTTHESIDGQRLANGVLTAVRALRGNELFVRIVELDPELILPYLLARRGRSQQLILDLLTTAIESGQAKGTIRDGSPAALARAIVLATHGFVLSAHTMIDDAVTSEHLDAEFVAMISRMVDSDSASPR